MKKRKKFKCKNEAQKRAIKASYARKAAAQNKTISSSRKSLFKLPLKNGGHRWNIYKVPNLILQGKNDGDIHGGLVIDEENDNVMLVEVTHSAKNGKRNNLQVRNLRSSDLDKNGQLRQSHIRKKLVVSIENKNGVEGINVSALDKQMNDLQFTEAEKQTILDELSHLSTAEERYKLFKELAKRKGDT